MSETFSSGLWNIVGSKSSQNESAAGVNLAMQLRTKLDRPVGTFTGGHRVERCGISEGPNAVTIVAIRENVELTCRRSHPASRRMIRNRHNIRK